MVNNVKAGYVNPLTMMKNGKIGQTKSIHLGVFKTAEKKQKFLEAEKQSLQNSLLLMKGTSGDAGGSEENMELLEKKLEEITNEIKTSRQEATEKSVMNGRLIEETRPSVISHNFDRYEKTENGKSAGCYRIIRDDNGDYKIEFDGIQ